jgi:hypothetical protein
MVPGKPISTHGMTQKLNRRGILVRTARNGALAALAADLPSPILADVTGMHRHAALRWIAYAKRTGPSTSLPEVRTNRQTPFKLPTNLARLFFAHSGGDRHGPANPAHRTVRARPP